MCLPRDSRFRQRLHNHMCITRSSTWQGRGVTGCQDPDPSSPLAVRFATHQLTFPFGCGFWSRQVEGPDRKGIQAGEKISLINIRHLGGGLVLHGTHPYAVRLSLWEWRWEGRRTPRNIYLWVHRNSHSQRHRAVRQQHIVSVWWMNGWMDDFVLLTRNTQKAKMRPWSFPWPQPHPLHIVGVQVPVVCDITISHSHFS